MDRRIGSIVSGPTSGRWPRAGVAERWASRCSALAGMAVLLAFTNPLTAWLTLASLLGYAALYTGFLKRATPQNIVIGGLAEAAPPAPWVAVTGHLSAEPRAGMIIFATDPTALLGAMHPPQGRIRQGRHPDAAGDPRRALRKLHILLYTLVLFTR